MLNTILSFAKPAEQIITGPPNPELIKPKAIPWAVRRQMLEDEDRKKAQVLADQAKKVSEANRAAEIDKLEKELKIEQPQGVANA